MTQGTPRQVQKRGVFKKTTQETVRLRTRAASKTYTPFCPSRECLYTWQNEIDF